MVVYLDLVLILNYSVDFLLLMASDTLLGRPGSRLRCALGAALGAGYGAACFLPGLGFLDSGLWRLVFLALVGAAAFGPDSAGWKRTGAFVLLSLALNGLTAALGRGELPLLLLCAGGLWLLCRLLLPGGGPGSRAVLTIAHQGKRVSLNALRDTGNTLRDPITGEAVYIIGPGAARELTGLTARQLREPLATLEEMPLGGLRLIPYRAVGCAGGLLLAKTMDNVTVGGRQKRAVIAFAPEGLGEAQGCEALVTG